MFRVFRHLLVLSLLITACLASPSFAHSGSDLKPDSQTRFGVLPNAMRYAIRANQEPKGRAALRVVFLTGSLMENDRQQGLAHFLEHMSFNGSQNFAPGTLIEFFQRMGMNFGGDTNAYTSFDHTVYMIDLPDTKESTLSEGFKVLSDYAGGLLLQENEIEKEKGVILAELRTRDSVPYRTLVAEYRFLYADTRLPLRFPIGIENCIRNSTREDFLDFYNTWYRPGRTAVVAVGDFDPAQVEKLLTESLGKLADRSPEREEPAFGAVPEFSGLRVAFHREQEAPNTRVSLSTLVPYKPEPDTVAKRLAELPRMIAVSMLNRRLQILAKKENAPFNAASFSISEQFDAFKQASMLVTCRHDQWKAAVGVAEQEMRRAARFGFQAPELAEAVANVRNHLEQAVRTAPTRLSPSLARELIDSIVDETVFTSPETDLELFGPALSALTLDACNEALRKALAPENRYLFVSGNLELGDDPAAALRTAYDASKEVTLSAPEALAENPWAYTNFGPAGIVRSRTQVEDLGITLIQFENGVRLNVKNTDFEKDKIRISVRVGAGQLLEPSSKPGLATFASSAMNLGGLGKHSIDELQRLLAGKTVGLSFNVGSDALMLMGSTNPRDLELEFQLVAAQISDPGYRDEAMRVLQKGIEQLYNRLGHTPEGPLALEWARLLANGDHRFGLPSRELINQRTLSEVREWLSPQLAKGPIEVGVVGEVDLETLIPIVAKTLGALPPRDAKPAYEAERVVRFPDSPVSQTYEIDSKIPKARLVIEWPTTDGMEAKVSRRLSVLADVLADRFRTKLREEMGESYNPSGSSSASDTYPGYGSIKAGVTLDPAKAVQVAEVILALGEDLAVNGVTEDEFERAKRPLLTALKESLRNNGYWLTAVVARAQEKPITLEWARNRQQDIETMKSEEVTAFARQYLKRARAFQAVVVPKTK